MLYLQVLLGGVQGWPAEDSRYMAGTNDLSQILAQDGSSCRKNETFFYSKDDYTRFLISICVTRNLRIASESSLSTLLLYFFKREQ